MAPLAQLDRAPLAPVFSALWRIARPLLYGAWLVALSLCILVYAAGAFCTLLFLGQFARARFQFRRDVAQGRAWRDRLRPKDGAFFYQLGE